MGVWSDYLPQTLLSSDLQHPGNQQPDHLEPQVAEAHSFPSY